MEVLIVVVILAVLAGLAMPVYIRTVARAREGEGWLALSAIRSAELGYYTEHEEIFTSDVNDLDIEDPSAPPAGLFDYEIYLDFFCSSPHPCFMALARPRPTCSECRNLWLDNRGGRNQTAP